MLKFDNAFMCKSGVVGMQFQNKKRQLVSVFHDGKSLQVSQDFPTAQQQEAMQHYTKMLHKFI